MDEQLQRLARSFGSVAEAYERGRPDYPREAVDWLVGRRGATVLELGAGTGKLTAGLVAAGHDVHATDPDATMLELLRERVPGARASVTTAEEIPLGDRSVDVVVAAQSFHWFDHARALPEIARVLKPGGHLALVWNARDERIPWVRRLFALLGESAPTTASNEILVASPLFGFVEEETFHVWQDINRETIVDLAVSRSYVATLEESERAAKVAQVLAFYDDYGRGMDGMQLPYLTHCFRATVVDRADDGVAPDQGGITFGTGGPGGPGGTDGTDPDMLLIDFR